MENTSVRYYNEHAQAYFQSTVHLDMTRSYRPFLKHLKPGAKILDAGCGSGRDSLYFKRRGFEVTAFDASKELVALSAKLLDQEVLLMRFEDLTLPDRYDRIWACASLLHVDKEKLAEVLRNLTAHLKDGGIFYMSFKYGEGERWIDGRYFHNLNETDLERIIQQVPELRIREVFVSDDVRAEKNHECWLNAYLLRT
ncbi:MAG TPA: class I SAM-dependent methyltransferase [Firmicutes bacterium]|nr:class I SAM-dependent methyltransferase [Bacillota bacterium]